MGNGLAEIIYPLKKKDFFKNYWPNKPFVAHRTDSKLDFFHKHPLLESIETVLGNRATPSMASLPDFNDEYSSISLDPKDALKAYRCGMTLTIGHAHTQIPEISGWLANMRLGLGLPEELSKERSVIYASPHGRGTDAHYDCNINFVVQLRGKKTWRLAENTCVENPVTRWTMGTPVPEELAQQCKKPLINRMPTNAMKVELKPGSVLFVPRGYWHETLAEGESLSLNFTFCQPTWIDVFSKVLQKKLSLHSKWRSLADGYGSIDEAVRQKAMDEFSKLLGTLGEDLAPMTAESFFPQGVCYSRPKNVELKITGKVATIYRGSKKLIDITGVDKGTSSFLNAVLKSESIIDLNEVRKKNIISGVLCENLIDELEKLGALKKVS